MKKTLLWAMCLVLLFLTACTSPTDPGPSTETSSPPPETKTVFVHTSITQEFGSSVNRTEYLFDDEDHVCEVVVYTNDTQTKRHSVECDENGNYIKWTAEGSVTEYAYDDEGHSLGVTLYINNELVSSTQYTWENGLRTSVTTSIAAQGITQRAVMTYDSAGQLLRQDTYTAETLTNYSIYTNGENGRHTSITTYQPDGTQLYTTAFQYTDSMETATTTSPDGTVTQTTVKFYDEHGNLLTQEIYSSDGSMISKETHTWKAIEVPPDCPRASV